ncbi:hypothetical protein NW765_007776 [Fusarium oxysporum]|nr:hypothetical protein NW765_007776 [Fusarium oxysporum]
MAITEQEAAKSSHTHLVMVILVVCFAFCVSILFVALRFWCRCIIGLSYWDDAAAVMALLCIIGMGSCILTRKSLPIFGKLELKIYSCTTRLERPYWHAATGQDHAILQVHVYRRLLLQRRTILGKNDISSPLLQDRNAVLLAICIPRGYNGGRTLEYLPNSDILSSMRPLEAVWNRDLRMKCVTNRLELAYVCAGINILTDLVVAILPLPVIWKLNLRRSQKIALSTVFGLGCFSIALAIVRIKWVERWSLTTWDIVRPQLWALAEVTSALVCACIPTFKPLLSKINGIIVGRKRNATEFVLEGHRSDVEFNAGSIKHSEGFSEKPRHDRVYGSETSAAVEQHPWL